MSGALTALPPEPRDSRVLVLSQRGVRSPLWHGTQYEFEDVIAELDDVQLLSGQPSPASEVRGVARRALDGARRASGRPRRNPPWPLPLRRASAVTTEHDLFFAVFHHTHELLDLHRLVGWRQRCRQAACLLVETWTPDLLTDRDYLQLLLDFDVVFVSNPAIVPGLEAMGVRRVRHMSSATDSLRFCPLPDPPERVLDCYNYGRSSPVTHAALLELVDRSGLTYLYDTTTGARLADPTHRRLLANMMQRAQFFLAYNINDSPERRARTGGDEVISTRYFEATAGGAVLLGSRPPAPEFDACFDWPDVVIPVPYACHGIADVLDDLRAQPERLAAARAANVRNSLRRHDWSHRWAAVLHEVDLSPPARLHERQAELDDLAVQVTPESVTHARSRERRLTA